MLPTGVISDTVQAMGRSIIQGEWRAGELLPMEAELAGKFGIGRNALREAVKVLAGKGLIRTARRYGTRIADKSEWNCLDVDVLRWRLHDRASHAKFRREVSQFRELFEPGAAAMAALNAKPEERENIVMLARSMQEIASTQAIETDIAFHLAILQATHNTLIQGLGRPFEEMLRILFLADLNLTEHGLSYDPNPTLHLALANAIAGGHAEEARYIAMAFVIRGVEGADRLEMPIPPKQK